MVKSYSTTASTEEEWFSNVIPHIAELLEMNYNPVDKVMYAGDDNSTGFLFEKSSDMSNIYVYPYVNGSKVALSSTDYYGHIVNANTSAIKYLFYSKTRDGYVFNFSNSSSVENLESGYCTKTDTETNVDSFCYFGQYKKMFCKEGYFSSIPFPNVLNTNQAVNMYNFMTSDGRFFCKNMFVPIFFPAATNHMKFTIRGKLFSSTPSNGSATARIIVPLDEGEW